MLTTRFDHTGMLKLDLLESASIKNKWFLVFCRFLQAKKENRSKK